MGQQDAFVDAAAVRAVADRFDDTAHLIESAVRTHLGGLAFDGACAGRDYAGQGDAIRFALHRLTGELAQWARATGEVVNALRSSAGRYTEADRYAAAGIG